MPLVYSRPWKPLEEEIRRRERARKWDEENQGNSSGLTAGEGPRMRSLHRSLRTGQVWGGGLRETSTHGETSSKTTTDSKKKTHSLHKNTDDPLTTWHMPLALGGGSFWLWLVSDCLISFWSFSFKVIDSFRNRFVEISQRSPMAISKFKMKLNNNRHSGACIG